MICPCCGAAELVRDTRDLPFTLGGEPAGVVTGVTGDFCPACGESLLDIEQSDRVMRAMKAAQG